jgi:enoyl-[acyl-carrier protein] reductase III
MSLAGKVVLVTGGTRGIGRAIALRLAREKPAHIVCAYYVNHDAAAEAVSAIEAAGASASAVATDVGDPRRFEELFRQIDERHGRLDVFISNAARTAFRPVMELAVRTWSRVVELNAQAFLVGSQLSARMMKKTGGGRIVGISSLGAQFCPPDYAALGASKAAMESLARYLACELASMNINVNVVSGGYVDTETMRLHPDYENLARQVIARTPGRRLAQPEDLAGIVAFLCAPESDWIRGQTIIADGGFSLSM